MSWKKRPIFCDSIIKPVDYLIFIDESGSNKLKNVLKYLSTPELIPLNDRVFSISACVFPYGEYYPLGGRIVSLKEKYWQNGCYCYEGQNRRVCFHGTEIHNKKNAFSESLIDYIKFVTDLDLFMSGISMTLFSAVIDKVQLCQKYHTPIDPYKLSLDFILERIVKFFLKPEETCVIIIEKRGKKEDREILRHIVKLIDNGTRFSGKEYFSKIDFVGFNPKWCESTGRQTSYYGLEIADLCEHSVYKNFTTSPNYRSYLTIEKYFHMYPRHNAKGLKIFPGVY